MAPTGSPPGPRGPRGLILDFGGVMTMPVFGRLPDADSDLAQLAVFFLRETRAVYAETEGSHDLHLFEKGLLSETDFFARLCERAERAGLPRVDPDQIRSALTERGITACVAMVDAVRHIRQRGLVTALLTNNAKEWGPQWRPVVPLDELFDVVVDSSEVGMRKPDPEIYLLTCRKMGLDPVDCTFVDDLECNIEAAIALGMEGVLCADPVRVAGELLARLAPPAP